MSIFEMLLSNAMMGESGGGGGSSDFSTATVTVTADEDSDGSGWGMFIVNDSLTDGWAVTFGSSVTFEVVMYKNQPSVFGIGTESEIATTGDLSYDADEGTVTVTGDGTITLTFGK